MVLYLIFLLSLLIAKVAPSLGMGPSAVLTTLVSTGGTPNSPGYPLYSLLAEITLKFPFGEPALKLNILAAIISTISIYILGEIGWRFLEIINKEQRASLPPSRSKRLFFHFTTALIIFSSQALIRHSIFADRYSLATLITLLSLYSLVQFFLYPDSKDSKVKFLYALIFLCGLAPTAHFLIVPPTFLFLLCAIALPSLKFEWKQPLMGCLFFILGLSFYLWLPFKTQNPQFFTWGHPNNFANLKEMLLRSEYAGMNIPYSLELFRPQWLRQYNLLVYEFKWYLIFPFLTFFALIRKGKWIPFAIGVASLLIAGEGVTLMTNFLANQDGLAKGYMYWFMQNYYHLYYFFVAGLCSTGLFLVGQFLGTLALSLRSQRSSKIPFVEVSSWVILTILFITALRQSYTEFTKPHRDPQIIDEFVDNIEEFSSPGSVILTNVDSFYFPCFYKQYFNHRLPKRLLIHTDLLKRSWYIESLLTLNHPALAKVTLELKSFQVLLKQFEGTKNYQSNPLLWRVYDNIVNQISQNSESYFLQIPELNPWGALDFKTVRFESNGILNKINRGVSVIEPFHIEKLKVSQTILAMKENQFWGLAFFNFMQTQIQDWIRLARFVEPDATQKAFRQLTDWQAAKIPKKEHHP